MRDDAFLHMLDATARMQWNMAMMLEAKAVEAEKVRNWAINHLSEHAFANHVELLKETVGIHDQLVEVMDGLTKLELGLAHNLKVILNRDADAGMGMGMAMGGYGGGYDNQFGMGDFDGEASSPGMGGKG